MREQGQRTETQCNSLYFTCGSQSQLVQSTLEDVALSGVKTHNLGVQGGKISLGTLFPHQSVILAKP